MTNNTTKEWEREFDELLDSMDDWTETSGRGYEKLKSFISETLERERESVIKMIEERAEQAKCEECGTSIQWEISSLLSKLREKE